MKKVFLPFIQELKEFGIKFIQTPETFIEYSNNIKCRGFFSHEDGLLKISSCEEFEEIFIHEFSHFLQYKNQTSIWRKVIQNNSIKKMDDWLNYKAEFEYNEISKIIDDVYELEKECEEIALELIKKNNLPINNYEEKALNYLKYYFEVLKTRQFNSINSI